MPRTCRRKAADAMIGASSLGAVVAGASVLSLDVRMAIANLIAGDPAGRIGDLAFRSQGLARELFRAATDYRTDNGPMFAFALVAVVLGFLMFKT